MSHPESQFVIVEPLNSNQESLVFGRDTDRIFNEVDLIRHKQIELATEHIGLDSIDEMALLNTQTINDNTNDESKRNSTYFNKENALKSLMSKLETLGQIMNDFREASDLNPHTVTDDKIKESPNISRKIDSA